jgi:hypothetical protein
VARHLAPPGIVHKPAQQVIELERRGIALVIPTLGMFASGNVVVAGLATEGRDRPL